MHTLRVQQGFGDFAPVLHVRGLLPPAFCLQGHAKSALGCVFARSWSVTPGGPSRPLWGPFKPLHGLSTGFIHSGGLLFKVVQSRSVPPVGQN